MRRSFNEDDQVNAWSNAHSQQSRGKTGLGFSSDGPRPSSSDRWQQNSAPNFVQNSRETGLREQDRMGRGGDDGRYRGRDEERDRDRPSARSPPRGAATGTLTGRDWDRNNSRPYQDAPRDRLGASDGRGVHRDDPPRCIHSGYARAREPPAAFGARAEFAPPPQAAFGGPRTGGWRDGDRDRRVPADVKVFARERDRPAGGRPRSPSPERVRQRSASPPKRGVSRVLPAWMMAEAAAPLVNKDGTYIDEFGRERQVADAPPPSSALTIDASSVKNTLSALKSAAAAASSSSSSSSSSAIASLLSTPASASASGRDDMRARVSKNMPGDGAAAGGANWERFDLDKINALAEDNDGKSAPAPPRDGKHEDAIFAPLSHAAPPPPQPTDEAVQGREMRGQWRDRVARK